MKPDSISGRFCPFNSQFNPEQPFASGIDIPPTESEERMTYLLDLFHFQLDCIENPIFKPIKTGPKHVMAIFVPLTLGTLGT